MTPLFYTMKKNALTLIEILVATLILAITMAGLVNLFMSGKKLLLRNPYRMTAVDLGRFLLDPLQMNVSASLWTSTCLGGNAANCPSVGAFVTSYASAYTFSTITIGGTPRLRKATVRITWNELNP